VHFRVMAHQAGSPPGKRESRPRGARPLPQAKRPGCAAAPIQARATNQHPFARFPAEPAESAVAEHIAVHVAPDHASSLMRCACGWSGGTYLSQARYRGPVKRSGNDEIPNRPDLIGAVGGASPAPVTRTAGTQHPPEPDTLSRHIDVALARMSAWTRSVPCGLETLLPS